MSSSCKYVEKCMIFIDMAEGLCSRLYNAKLSFETDHLSPSCLSSKELNKVRKELEKSFPDSANLTKINGYDILKRGCYEIAQELSFFNEVILDVSDFRKEASFLLKDIAGSTLQHFKLDKSRSIVLLFFELLSSYYRVLSLLDSIQDKKTAFALYTSANAMATESTDVVGVSDAQGLFTALSHGHRFFIDDFFIQAETIGSMMLEFYDSIMAYTNPDNLRNKYVLNPSHDAESMTHPVKLQLNPRSNRGLSMHTELRDAPLYMEYVAIGFLICPSLLFHPDGKYMEIFRVAVTDQVVVKLYRDLNINIHAEYESIYGSYPSKRDTIKVPKGFKIKNILKEFATTAVETVGLKHRERRSFVLAEVKNLLHIARSLPGLLGPKFPMYVAAAAMARAEILRYFSHRQLESRRDMKKKLQEHSADYSCPHITYLIDALYELSCLVEEYQEIVTMYYGEYLSLCDAPTLETLCEKAMAEFPDSINASVHSIVSSIPSHARKATCDEDHDFSGFRMNWDRYSTLLGTVWGKFAGQGNFDLTAYMIDVRDRSEYVDNLSDLLKRYFLPYDIWWHKPFILEEFDKGFKLNAKPLCFFPTLSYVSLCVHDDNAIESTVLSDQAWKFCDMLMGKFSSKHFMPFMDEFWSIYDDLEKKTQGKEAIQRLERQYAHKQARDKALASGKKDSNLTQPELPPGYESEGWAAKHIEPLVQVRGKLLNLMSSVKAIGTFLVFNREYNIEFAVREAISFYFASKLKKMISQGNGEIARPSLILKDIVVGCRVIQALSNVISVDLPQLLRTFLYDNFCDTSTPPPGTVLSGRIPSAKEDKEESAIWTIGRWFTKFVDEAAAQNSGLMWIPSTNGFARSDSKQRPIEAYINKEEIACLCSFIGPQGVRCIDSMLLQVVAEKVATLKNFVASNVGKLKHVLHGQSDISQLLNVENSHPFLVASVEAGVALALREILHLGLRDSMQFYAPFVQSTLSSVVSSVSPWEKPDISTPLYSLAFDVGVIPDVDLSLKASLASVIHTDEDKENLALLNVAFASCFASSYWTQNSVFLPKLGAFRGNQHCLSLTMAKLIMCFADADPESGPFADALKSRANKFVELSANMILHMRSQGSKFDHHPVRAFTNILELFLRYCPLVDHYSLEKFLPYAFIHASQMEIAMGQVRGSDDISAGMNRVIQAESIKAD